MSDFPKFPKVPHYGSALEDPDIYVPHEAPYVVTEKMDGSNISIHRKSLQWVLASRNNIVARYYDDGHMDIFNEFRGFVEFFRRNIMDPIIQNMEFDDSLYGEWLVPHTVRYPPDMYNKVYLFDYNPNFTDDTEFREVPWARVFDKGPSLKDMQAVMDGMDLERDWEGVVLSCERELKPGQFKPRFKMLNPKFREQQIQSWSMKKALRSAPIEQRVLTYYPFRAYEKVAERIYDEEGKLTKQQTAKLLGMTWHDFLTEYLPQAIKKEKNPTINFSDLKKEFDNKIRDIFFTKLDTGEYPVWVDRM